MWDSISKYLKGKSSNPEVDQFTKNLQADINKDGTVNKGIIAGIDTDSSAPDSYSDLQSQKNEIADRENPMAGREAIDVVSSVKKPEDNKMAKGIGEMGKTISDAAGKNVMKAQYGNMEQALGKPVDVMEERRAALMKLLGR